MSVAPPQAGILPPRIQPAPSRSEGHGNNQPQGQSGGEGFAELLSQARAMPLDAVGKKSLITPANITAQELYASQALADLDAGLPVVLGPVSYSLKVKIGEDAVSFDARPIVGPASFEAAVDPTVQTAPAAEPSAEALSLIDPAIADRTSTAQPRAWFGVGEDRGQVVIGPMAPRGIAAMQTRGAVGPAAQASGQAYGAPSANHRSAQGTHSIQPLGESGRPQSEAQGARAHVFAQLLASASEYRVAVRGTRLSESEAERLAQAIRSVLKGYGLADLPVVLSAPGGGA